MSRSVGPNERYEIYELNRSPFAQKPTQRDIASLVGETRDDLRRMANYKEQFIKREQKVIGKKGKLRDLAYPVGPLRAVHERLKFHLNKIKQPSYLFSPRRGRGQRDNAALHLNQEQFLTLDLKQFYPSTTEIMVRRWFREHLGMYEDVAGLLTHLCTVDGKVSFGSPLSPVLCSLIHRPMFDQIAAICEARGLLYSVWVDDLTISGRFVPRDVLNQIRVVIHEAGLKSHSIKYRTGNRRVFITGIGVNGSDLVAPNSLNIKIRDQWAAYHAAKSLDERSALSSRLLMSLGSYRHIAGARSMTGRKAADQMNSLRQKQKKAEIKSQETRKKERELQWKTELADTKDAPF